MILVWLNDTTTSTLFDEPQGIAGFFQKCFSLKVASVIEILDNLLLLNWQEDPRWQYRIFGLYKQ